MPSQRSVLRTASLLVILSILGVLTFRMFDYALTWPVGWSTLRVPTDPAQMSFSAPNWEGLEAIAMLILTDGRRELSAPALSAAISVEGRRVWAGAVGTANLERDTPAGLESQFRLGSTSKAITSVALGTLMETQQINLDLPVGSYILDLDQPLASVTTRQAMSHTAGIRNYGMCWCFPVWEHLNRRPFGRAARPSLSIFATDPLIFAAGTNFSYSSYGTNTVGAVIEAIVGVDYLDYIQLAVLDALQMKGSGPDLRTQQIPHRASFYDVEDGKYRLAYPVDNSYKWPSGGLIATPSDMLSLGEEMLRPTLFSTAIRDLLIEPQTFSNGDDNPEGYALGWRFLADKKLFSDTVTTRFVSHHGIATGSTSYFAFYPDYELVVSVMMNRSSNGIASIAALATELVELFVGEAPMAQPAKSSRLPP